MRSISAALCAITIIVGAAMPVFAQGMLPGGPGPFGFLPACYFSCPKPATAKPSLGAGYVWASRKTDFTLTADGPGLGGITERRVESDLSSVYLSGTVPVIMRNMGGMVLSGACAIPSRSDMKADDLNPPGTYVSGRRWSGRTGWAIADMLFAYAIRPGLSGVTGYRWDYWQTGYNDPRDPSGTFLEGTATDTADFYMETWMPLVGLAGNFSGMRMAGMVGVASGGTVKYQEVRNGGGVERFDVFSGDAGKAYFFELTGELTVASGFIREGVEAELTIFGKYNSLKQQADLKGRRTGTATAQDTFDFEIKRDLMVAGAEASVTF